MEAYNSQENRNQALGVSFDDILDWQGKIQGNGLKTDVQKPLWIYDTFEQLQKLSNHFFALRLPNFMPS